MRLAATFIFAAALAAQAATPQASPDPRLGDSYKFQQSGWTYVHLAGTPEQIGYQHGFLLAREIEDNVHVYTVEAMPTTKRDWAFYRKTSETMLWPHIEPEYQAELKGIAEGLKAQGSKLDLWDVVALNAQEDLTDYYVPWLNARAGKKPETLKPEGPSHCSAFIATGSATKDGKIVIAHSNWSSYAEGERWHYIFDIVPAQGLHIFMDGAAGIITSQDDFGVNSAGLMITETTLPTTVNFDPNGIPEFERSRKAMQYATSIDEYAAIMRKGNNGGYQNTWLIGDRKTGEIAYLELGLKHTPLTRKTDGYFVSTNFAADPALIRDDTPTFDPTNMLKSSNARHVRAEDLVQQHYGEIDTAFAEQYLSDHYDVHSKKVGGSMRTLCGHEDASAEADPPYNSFGAVSGKVMDSDMAANLSFIARAGHPCGEDFHAAPFFAAHPEFDWQKPILNDMIAGPWTPFHGGEKPPA
jgi:hypothetical protein